jgi:hypothetical protein
MTWLGTEIEFFLKKNRSDHKDFVGKETKQAEKENTRKTPGMFGNQYQFCKTHSKLCANPCTATRNNSGEAELSREIN